jgi:hypothetical protein
MTQFVFGRFVIERNLSEYFDEALKMLEEFTEEADFIFPAHRYSYFAICAVIASKRDQVELARECAQSALAAAEQKQSGIKRHPNVGLVNKPPASIHAELERLAM